MAGRNMTLAQWRRELGETLPIGQASREAHVPQLVITRAVRTGELPLHTFRAVDGRVFRHVRVSDLSKLTQARTSRPLSIEAMVGAFHAMVGKRKTDSNASEH